MSAREKGFETSKLILYFMVALAIAATVVWTFFFIQNTQIFTKVIENQEAFNSTGLLINDTVAEIDKKLDDILEMERRSITIHNQ